MTSLIATEFDNERGRTKIMAIAHLEYKRYFSTYERNLLKQISNTIVKDCGEKATRHSIEKYLHSQRNMLQEITLCAKYLGMVKPDEQEPNSDNLNC